MEPDRWKKAKALFEAAFELEGKERDRFIDRACGGDEQLALEVKKLLASLDEADTFLERGAAAEVTGLLDDAKTIANEKATGNLDSVRLVVGNVLAGRYRILGLLGKGGMGEVYKAEDIKLTQTVALKFLPERLARDKASLARFHSEVRMARQVSHPNVCRVFDIGETGGHHFISMEYIHGDDLASMLRRIGRLASDKAVVIARQLCFGLAAIHDAGILHRDLKPANVIIDDNGKARITDFGIAGVESELDRSDTRIGTPAYMSPEQIKGVGISQRSDIYSLGLLMYEVFTGKQTFEADSMIDLLVKQETTAPTNPSDVLKEIDPIVEKTILQCLEKNPDDRPKTALQVAMMLPGGNPLEAAIAAGDTPSPEMVAAAPKKGALRPAVAVSCLSAFVLLFAFTVLFSAQVKHHEWIPLEKSPEVLAERSESILKKLGYAAEPTDTAYGWGNNNSEYDRYESAHPSADSWERLRSGQPAVTYFWYRTSPRYLEPLQFESVLPNDPPNDVSGMTRVVLDPRGRLLEMQAVPPQVPESAPSGAETDWTPLFAEAGLDMRNYVPAQSTWTPPVFADRNAAWAGAHVDHAEIPVRIEAASFRGRPVYFQVVAPWDAPHRQEEISSTPARRAAGVMLILVFLSVAVAGLFLARRNYLDGRSDTNGALKITLFLVITVLAASLLRADHVPDLVREASLLVKTVALSLFSAIAMAVLYMALEPFVRRRWPGLIISWSRLLAGDFKDPLVGRDILVGGLLGLTHTAIIYIGPILQQRLGQPSAPNASLDVSNLDGLSTIISNVLLTPAGSIRLAFATLLMLVVFVAVLRKRWLAIGLVWALYYVILGLLFASDGYWTAWLGTGAIATVTIFCISRFGLLAMIAYYSFFHLSFHTAITADVSSWYFTNTLVAGAILLGLAAFGFYTSLAGQPIFAGKMLREMEN
ncbi:MAG TPA: serine/threonine-protein kinase [Pyrinomonadaceae bacterium]|nr:serine/threonine-protein kinase [Pyrinomonadaceae bacterium]